MAGRFITFEGIDGAGKSTQLAVLAERLRGAGIDLVVTREPGGTALGERLRELVLGQPMQPTTETLLMFAARAEHLARVIRPALASGQWVLCDRFTDATYAYQSGGRGLSAEAISALEAWTHAELQPDLTFLVDLAPAVAATRLAQARDADRFEAEREEFFARVRAVYLARARAAPHRIRVLDGSQDVEALSAQLITLVDAVVEQWRD